MSAKGSCCPPAGPGLARPDDREAMRPSTTRPLFRWCDVPGGTFSMGSDAGDGDPADGEGPSRRVTLGAYAIAAHTVTNAQFGEFVRETGYATDAERLNWSFVFRNFVPDDVRSRITKAPAGTPWWLPVPRAYWAQPEGPGSTVLDRLTHPVVHVSWSDAHAYCGWSGTRLPTEAEWERAARGEREGARFPWGDELQPDGTHRCNVWQGEFPDRDTGQDGFAGTAPANAFKPNGLGLYNVVGNVWEWCADDFSPDYHRLSGTIDPLWIEPGAPKSLRGGSFLCHASYCNRYRVPARSSNPADSSASNVGFRVVRQVDGTAGAENSAERSD